MVISDLVDAFLLVPRGWLAVCGILVSVNTLTIAWGRSLAGKVVSVEQSFCSSDV